MKNIPIIVYNFLIKEIQIFEKKFNSIITSNVLVLNNVINYIKSKKGKQIRPIFVFLITKMLGNVSDKTYDLALLVELIHTGTILHDDVIDNSNLRRGCDSIRKIWNNKIAVLVGDYFLSKSILLATQNKHYDLLKIISNTILHMSKGELLQITTAKTLNINEKIYNKIITYKTASLISACCEGAVRSINLNYNIISQMYKFGILIGQAFQIQDDINDYQLLHSSNKPTGGIDIKAKKITLPLIYTLKHASNSKKKWIMNIINHQNNYNTSYNTELYDLISYVKESGGLIYAYNKMISLKMQALDIIKMYPNNLAKKTLQIMLNFIIKNNI